MKLRNRFKPRAKIGHVPVLLILADVILLGILFMAGIIVLLQNQSQSTDTVVKQDIFSILLAMSWGNSEAGYPEALDALAEFSSTGADEALMVVAGDRTHPLYDKARDMLASRSSREIDIFFLNLIESLPDNETWSVINILTPRMPGWDKELLKLVATTNEEDRIRYQAYSTLRKFSGDDVDQLFLEGVLLDIPSRGIILQALPERIRGKEISFIIGLTKHRSSDVAGFAVDALSLKLEEDDAMSVVTAIALGQTTSLARQNAVAGLINDQSGQQLLEQAAEKDEELSRLIITHFVNSLNTQNRTGIANIIIEDGNWRRRLAALQVGGGIYYSYRRGIDHAMWLVLTDRNPLIAQAALLQLTRNSNNLEESLLREIIVEVSTGGQVSLAIQAAGILNGLSNSQFQSDLGAEVEQAFIEVISSDIPELAEVAANGLRSLYHAWYGSMNIRDLVWALNWLDSIKTDDTVIKEIKREAIRESMGR